MFLEKVFVKVIYFVSLSNFEVLPPRTLSRLDGLQFTTYQYKSFFFDIHLTSIVQIINIKMQTVSSKTSHTIS